MSKNKDDYIIKEYELLKTEIQHKVEMQTTMVMTTVAAVVAIWTFVIGYKNWNHHPELFLLPQIIIITIEMRYSFYVDRIANISQYMIVFLESADGFGWEGRNKSFKNYRLIDCETFSKRNTKGLYSISRFLQHGHFVIFSIMSSVFMTFLGIANCWRCYYILCSWLASLLAWLIYKFFIYSVEKRSSGYNYIWQDIKKDAQKKAVP